MAHGVGLVVSNELALCPFRRDRHKITKYRFFDLIFGRIGRVLVVKFYHSALRGVYLELPVFIFLKAKKIEA